MTDTFRAPTMPLALFISLGLLLWALGFFGDGPVQFVLHGLFVGAGFASVFYVATLAMYRLVRLWIRR